MVLLNLFSYFQRQWPWNEALKTVPVEWFLQARCQSDLAASPQLGLLQTDCRQELSADMILRAGMKYAEHRGYQNYHYVKSPQEQIHSIWKMFIETQNVHSVFTFAIFRTFIICPNECQMDTDIFKDRKSKGRHFYQITCLRHLCTWLNQWGKHMHIALWQCSQEALFLRNHNNAWQGGKFLLNQQELHQIPHRKCSV